jgi:NAD-dependent deacetylase
MNRPSSRSPDGIDALRDALGAARHPLIMTGAGVSIASGIPAYRSGPDSVWASFAEDWANRTRFQEEPTAWWSTFWKKQLAPLAMATPNDAHHLLNALVLQHPGLRVITQNIDGLHARSGLSSSVHIEVHGRADRIRCDEDDCAGRRSWEMAVRRQLAIDEPPRCPTCFGIARPSVLLFDEIYASHIDYRYLEAATWIAEADLLLLIGTSNAVSITEHAIGSALVVSPVRQESSAPGNRLEGRLS